VAKWYAKQSWRNLRLKILNAAGWKCSACGADLKTVRWQAQVDHIHELGKHPDLAMVRANLRALCLKCHNKRHERDRIASLEQTSPRPKHLPKPGCTVIMVCGPPGSGKSTYADQHKGPLDTVIDFDRIAAEYGFERGQCPVSMLGVILAERNRRIAELEHAPSSHKAWVILHGASKTLRNWWQAKLGAADVVVLTPAKPELERRIKADPQRHRTTGRDLRLVEQWYARERADDVGHVRRGCDVNGNPLDELHPWRQEGARGGMRESHGRNF
jgi:5-methylcytosine-specific restriction protein A